MLSSWKRGLHLLSQGDIKGAQPIKIVSDQIHGDPAVHIRPLRMVIDLLGEYRHTSHPSNGLRERAEFKHLVKLAI